MRACSGASAGVPLPTAAAVLGHADIATTAICTTAVAVEPRGFLAKMGGRFPFRRLCRGRGAVSSRHRMSSQVSGCCANPGRIAGVVPSSPTLMKFATVRKTVRYLPIMAGLYGW